MAIVVRTVVVDDGAYGGSGSGGGVWCGVGGGGGGEVV